MRILAHVHSFNDGAIIDRTIRALVEQSQPVDEILLVDNGSTDDTPQRVFPETVTVLRLPENLGTSGAVVKGFQYALANGYDWIWLFDADSVPCSNALAKLIELYQSFPPDLQAQTWVLASLPVDAATRTVRHGSIFIEGGYVPVQPDPGSRYYECDGPMWTGSLYKLEAVRKVHLPRADYVLDGGECEYGYRGKQLGFKAFMDQNSILHHNIEGQPSFRVTIQRFGPVTLQRIDFPPIRLYYTIRNMLYFWLHEYHRGNVYRFLRQSPWVPRQIVKLCLLSRKRRSEIQACLLGLRDGLFRNMGLRYKG